MSSRPAVESGHETTMCWTSRGQISRQARPAFALIELIAVVICLAAIGVMVLTMSDNARRSARISEDLSNLRRIGTLTQSYGADFNDLVWSFSWRPGNYTTHWPDLQSASSAIDAAAKQAVAIMRNRSSIQIPVISGWLPHPGFNHLVLYDYADENLPQRWFISTGDRHRLNWVNDPQCFLMNCFWPYQPSTSTSSARRWLFSASFELGAAFYDQSPDGSRINQSGGLSNYSVPPNADLRGFALSQIAHPANKVMMQDLFSRHFGARQPVFMATEARVPLLLSDGSASVRLSDEANLGAHPNSWSSTWAPQYPHSPLNWEPPPVSGVHGGYGRYRWTRMGIKGRDFGGPEVWP
jgi:type II secretory pathway pseudopilin PulG